MQNRVDLSTFDMFQTVVKALGVPIIPRVLLKSTGHLTKSLPFPVPFAARFPRTQLRESLINVRKRGANFLLENIKRRPRNEFSSAKI